MGTAVEQSKNGQDAQGKQSSSTDFDSKRIEMMGQEVVGAMRGLRELLDARAKALEACRLALADEYRKLDEERSSFSIEQLELCERIEQREAELAAREKEYEGLKVQAEQLASTQKSQLEELRQRDEQANLRLAEMDKKVEELTARESAATAAMQKVEEQRMALEKERLDIEEARKEFGQASANMDEARARIAQKQQDIAKFEASVTTQQQQLAEQQKAFAAQQDALAQERKATESRRVELESIAQQLEAGRQELASQREMLAASQTEWDVKLRELQAASSSLASLQKHLDVEINTISEQTDELLPQYGVTRESANQGAPADKGMPTAQEHAANESLERFQKLCRDAKRRAIG